MMNVIITNERVESLCIFMNNLVENIDKNTKEKYKSILDEQHNNNLNYNLMFAWINPRYGNTP